MHLAPITPEALAEAKAEIERNPQLKLWLQRASISLEEFARAGQRVREALRERREREARDRLHLEAHRRRPDR